jgi:hypothetical protein
MKARLMMGAVSFVLAFTSFVSGAWAANAKGLGQHVANLLSGWLGPVIIVFAGGLCVFGLMKREMGILVTGVVGALVAGFFVFDPNQAEQTFKGIYNAIF